MYNSVVGLCVIDNCTIELITEQIVKVVGADELGNASASEFNAFDVFRQSKGFIRAQREHDGRNT